MQDQYIAIRIENETKGDFEEVEALTRKAFWNVNVPGCEEHYLARILREHEDFIPELDFVAKTADGNIVGNVMYTKAKLIGETGKEMPVLTLDRSAFIPITSAGELESGCWSTAFKRRKRWGTV